MVDQLPSLKRLLGRIGQVPYLSYRNSLKVADFFIKLSETERRLLLKEIDFFAAALENCGTCFALKERDAGCPICTNLKRKNELVCVVGTWQDLAAIERLGTYRGGYHVLGGTIYPLEGVGPEDLTIDELLARIEKHDVSEVMFALNQTPEGEATAAYIARKIKMAGPDIKISRIAAGAPAGSVIEFMDRVTLQKAIGGRCPF